MPKMMTNSSGIKKRKKKRHSSSQKRLAKEQRRKIEQLQEADQPDEESSKSTTHHRKKKKKSSTATTRTLLERTLACARNAIFTKSVSMNGISSKDNNNSNQLLHVRTSSSHLGATKTPAKKLDTQILSTDISQQISAEYMLRIQPLLILDLNGILCYRDRQDDSSNNLNQRSSTGHCAGTPIIPRPNVSNFLTLLDQHFCLAVWTSAKRKTAKEIIDLLFPRRVATRLLFVWAQNECTAVVEKSKDKKGEDESEGETVVYQKLLHKVWNAFPLWNANNTLLMDDSPEKCPYAVANGVHPPSMHGQIEEPQPQSSTIRSKSDRPWLSDDKNQQLQSQFFAELIQHWKSHSYENKIKPDDFLCIEEHMSNENFSEFLRTHACSHMGWRAT